MITPSPLTPTEPDWPAAAGRRETVVFHFRTSRSADVAAAYHRAAAATGRVVDDDPPKRDAAVRGGPVPMQSLCRLPEDAGHDYGSVVRSKWEPILTHKVTSGDGRKRYVWPEDGDRYAIDLAVRLEDCRGATYEQIRAWSCDQRVTCYWYRVGPRRSPEYRAAVWLVAGKTLPDKGIAVPYLEVRPYVVAAVHKTSMPYDGPSPYWVAPDGRKSPAPVHVANLVAVCPRVAYETAELLPSGDLLAWADAAEGADNHHAREKAAEVRDALTVLAADEIAQF